MTVEEQIKDRTKIRDRTMTRMGWRAYSHWYRFDEMLMRQKGRAPSVRSKRVMIVNSLRP